MRDGALPSMCLQGHRTERRAQDGSPPMLPQAPHCGAPLTTASTSRPPHSEHRNRRRNSGTRRSVRVFGKPGDVGLVPVAARLAPLQKPQMGHRGFAEGHRTAVALEARFQRQRPFRDARGGMIVFGSGLGGLGAGGSSLSRMAPIGARRGDSGKRSIPSCRNRISASRSSSVSSSCTPQFWHGARLRARFGDCGSEVRGSPRVRGIARARAGSGRQDLTHAETPRRRSQLRSPSTSTRGCGPQFLAGSRSAQRDPRPSASRRLSIWQAWHA